MIHESTDLTAFIARDGAELVTDSRAVAIAFEKRHADVLRTIDRMRKSARPASPRMLNAILRSVPTATARGASCPCTA